MSERSESRRVSCHTICDNYMRFPDCSEDCSRTCRMFVHPCYTHLFSRNAPQFAALLHQNPKIQRYVPDLSYYSDDTSEAIPNAFLMLDSVETLFIEGDDWSSLPPHIQRALVHLCNSPSVANIWIGCGCFINLPSILLPGCSNLKHLHLDCPVGLTFEVCDTM